MFQPYTLWLRRLCRCCSMAMLQRVWRRPVSRSVEILQLRWWFWYLWHFLCSIISKARASCNATYEWFKQLWRSLYTRKWLLAKWKRLGQARWYAEWKAVKRCKPLPWALYWSPKITRMRCQNWKLHKCLFPRWYPRIDGCTSIWVWY